MIPRVIYTYSYTYRFRKRGATMKIRKPAKKLSNTLLLLPVAFLPVALTHFILFKSFNQKISVILAVILSFKTV